MNTRNLTTLAILALGAPIRIFAAQFPPVPTNPIQAQTFWGFNIKTRCPDLRFADAGTKAVVIFWVPKRGIQSQISLKATSGSTELDDAAISCISKLRFAPATTVGDGEAVDSWQQVALSWADPEKSYAARTAASQTPTSTTAPINTAHRESGSRSNSVTVHACVDDKGKLDQEPTIVQSSGVAALDAAAVKIAAAGSSNYRPPTSSSTVSGSSCVQIAIEFGAK